MLANILTKWMDQELCIHLIPLGLSVSLYAYFIWKIFIKSGWNKSPFRQTIMRVYLLTAPVMCLYLHFRRLSFVVLALADGHKMLLLTYYLVLVLLIKAEMDIWPGFFPNLEAILFYDIWWCFVVWLLCCCSYIFLFISGISSVLAVSSTVLLFHPKARPRRVRAADIVSL